MRLGQRSARIRACNGGELIRLAIGFWLALAVTADARPATVGPARIVCNAAFCEMGSGARPGERVRVIVSDLSRDDRERLRRCTGVSKPCVVTIGGVEQGGPSKIMAETIDWQD